MAGVDEATSHYLDQWWLVCWRINASLELNELSIFNSSRASDEHVSYNDEPTLQQLKFRNRLAI